MDLSKAFDCMPFSLLITKLHDYGMHQNAVELLTSYLTERKQRVKVSDQYGQWLNVNKGVPQGSVVGPALFNFFINDMYGFIKKAALFNYADDNTLSFIADNVLDVKITLEQETKVAIKWFTDNMMEANPDKFHVMLLSKPSKGEIDFNININGNSLQGESNVELLGVIIDKHMNFNMHVKKRCAKAAGQLNALGRLRQFLDTESKIAILRSFITSNFSYCPLVWHFCGRKSTIKMECILKRALRLALSDYASDYETLLAKANLVSLEIQRQRTLAIEIFKAKNGMSPQYLTDIFVTNKNSYNTRQKDNLHTPVVNTTHYGLHSIQYLAAKIWNQLPREF